MTRLKMIDFRLLVCLVALLASSSSGGAARHSKRQPVHSNHASQAAAGPIHFEDIAKQAGLNFQLTCGSPEKHYILEAMCGGVAFFDYDNDGWADVLLVGGSTLEAIKSLMSTDC